MRYPLNLARTDGGSKKDTDIGFRMKPLPVAETATSLRTITPQTEFAETIVVLDTFTDADDTDPEDHVGETGATWTRPDFGQGIDSGRTFGIFDNALRRLRFDEPAGAGADGGESLIYPSGRVGAAEHYAIEFGFTAATEFPDDDSGWITVYQNGTDPSNADVLLFVGYRLGAPNFNLLFANAVGTPGTDVSFDSEDLRASVELGPEYIVRLEVNGFDTKLYFDSRVLDGDPIATPTLIGIGKNTVALREPFGFDLVDPQGEGVISMTYCKIATLS